MPKKKKKRPCPGPVASGRDELKMKDAERTAKGAGISPMKLRDGKTCGVETTLPDDADDVGYKLLPEYVYDGVSYGPLVAYMAG